jgi:ABC-2 type transport system permease protein
MSTIRAAILRRAIFDLRWHIGWYGIGLAFYGGLVAWLYPTFKDLLNDVQYPEDVLKFFGAGTDLSDPATFMTTEYHSFAPIIMIIFAVVSGTGLLAGDEGRGTLETLLAQPVSRTSVFLSRALALAVAAVAICALTTLGWLASVPFIDMGSLGLGTLILSSFAVLPVIAAFGAMAMLLSAIAPTRGMAAGIMTAIAIASYLISSFAQTIEAIAWLRWVSPYYYSDGPQVLTEGVVWWHQGALLVFAAMALFLGVLAFNGREIQAGTWQPRAIARGWRR